jgi:hypothetical protein
LILGEMGVPESMSRVLSGVVVKARKNIEIEHLEERAEGKNSCE